MNVDYANLPCSTLPNPRHPAPEQVQHVTIEREIIDARETILGSLVPRVEKRMLTCFILALVIRWEKATKHPTSPRLPSSTRIFIVTARVEFPGFPFTGRG